MDANSSRPATPRPKDFLRSAGGGWYAVVSPHVEEGRALCVVRYVDAGGALRKVGTAEGAAWVAAHEPGHRFRSRALGAEVHGVPLGAVVEWRRPEERLAGILRDGPRDALERRAATLARALAACGVPLARVGVTGSLLVGAQHAESDLDVVVHGRAAFQAARAALATLVREGTLAPLDDADWAAAWRRRGAALDLARWLAHERRKGTKALVAGTRVDLSLVPLPAEVPPPREVVSKEPGTRLVARVVDDAGAFDTPARWTLDHPAVGELLAPTATYTAQAFAGETIEAVGTLERYAGGDAALVVGSSREAPGEYLVTVPPPA